MQTKYIERLNKILIKESLASNTIDNYLQATKRFLEYFGEKDVNFLNQDDVAIYIRFLEERRRLKPQTINIELSAIAFFMDKVINHPIDKNLIPRKRRPFISIPDILTTQELKLILERISFKKHKIMIMLTYGCGITSSQLCNLKKKDLNFEHKQIKIPPYNRHKPSTVIALPDKIIPLLLNYIENDKPHKYLFEGKKPGKQYSIRVLQTTFNEALQQTGIQKNITLKI